MNNFEDFSVPVFRKSTSDDTETNGDAIHHFLRPYTFHGIELVVKGGHGVGDCPFCGGEGKFSVDWGNGLWRCFVCGSGTERGGGNALVFLRLLHERSVESTSPHPNARLNGSNVANTTLESIATDRRLCLSSTPAAWGVTSSPIPPYYWLVPGYDTTGKLTQLYRRVWINDGWHLLPTPGVWPDGKVHALHLPVSDFDPERKCVVVCEGPWDGMALWECNKAVWGDANIIAVPGCNVWRDEWTELCKGKVVTLLFDSDHPRTEGVRKISAGYEGMQRIAKRLSGIASSVQILRWGPDGYDEMLPNGWDVRDQLSGTKPNTPFTMVQRHAALKNILLKIEDVPTEWFSGLPSHAKSHSVGVEPQPCHTWVECESAWKEALEWRTQLGEVLVVMLAVATSTNQSGDNQLFLQVIGDPGSAKTRLCKGLLVSSKCKLILHLKSFHSGWKGSDGKDCSLVARINGLCLITPEADALSIGMSWEQLNSQMRQIFDGESGNTYGNSDEDRQYKGLRSPWIQAGTPALMDKDQSRLGDRFLRIRIEEPTQEVKRSIMLKSLRNERLAVLETSNGTESSIIQPKLRKAYALTGGYVDWLRANVEEKIALVDMSEDKEIQCLDLAELVADMRARPNMDPKKHEVHHSKELGSRLSGQFGRLALCIAVVLNKKEVDNEVINIVRKVALDTAYGHSLNIVRWLCSINPKSPYEETYQASGGLVAKVLEMWLSMTEERTLAYMLFLRKIDVVELIKSRFGGLGAWVLTERVYDLYLRIMSYGDEMGDE